MDRSTFKYDGPTFSIVTDADGFTVTRNGNASPKVVCDGKPNAHVLAVTRKRRFLDVRRQDCGGLAQFEADIWTIVGPDRPLYFIEPCSTLMRSAACFAPGSISSAIR